MTLCRTRSLEKHPDIAPVRLPSSTPLHICLAARYPNFMGAVTPQSPTEQRGAGAGAAGLVSVLEEPGEAQQDGVRCTACSPPLVATPKSIAKRAFEIENWAPSTQLEIVQLQRVSAAEIWDIILCQSNQCISYYEAISPLTFWGGYLNTSSLVLQSHHVVVRRIQKPSSFSLHKNPSHQTATHLETVYFYNREGALQAIPFTHCGLRALWAPQASESFPDSAIAPFNSTLHGKQTMIGERVSCFRRKMDWAAAIFGTS